MCSDRRIYTEGSNNSPYQLIGLPVPELPLKGLIVRVDYKCEMTGALSCDVTKSPFAGETEVCSCAEEQLSMSVAQKLQALLEKRGAKVAIPQIMCEGSVAESCHTLMKSSIPTDMCVRISADVFDDVSLCGITVYVPDSYYDTGKSRAAGEYVLNATTAATGAQGNGVKVYANWKRSQFAYRPTLQVSVGYMSNPDEDALIETEDYQQNLAQGMCDGIVQYFTAG